MGFVQTGSVLLGFIWRGYRQLVPGQTFVHTGDVEFSVHMCPLVHYTRKFRDFDWTEDAYSAFL